MKKRAWVVFGVVGLLLMLVGCSKEDESATKAMEDKNDTSVVVARVGKNQITRAKFQRYLDKRPVQPRSKSVQEEVGKRLDALVLEEVLYQEALRVKLDQDPDMRARIRQMLTQKLIDEQINKKEWKREISAEELKAYYEKHRKEFNRPAQVRLADIFIDVASDASKEVKDRQRKKAQAVLNEAVKVKGQRTGFGRLIRQHSDTPKKYRKGDTGFFDIEGNPVGIDKQLAQAAFQLDKVGSLAEQVIESSQGFHVVMLIGRRNAVNRPFQAIQNQLEQRIRRDAIKDARGSYFKKLKESVHIDIDKTVLSDIAAEQEQAVAARGPKTRPNKMVPRLRHQRPPIPPGHTSGPPLLPGKKQPK